MDSPKEYTADGMKSGEWKLEPGTYEVKDGKVFRVDSDYDQAADKFAEALKKLADEH